MPWIQVTIETSEQNAEKISEILSEAGALSVTFQDAADQPLFEPEPETTPLWDRVHVIGLFDAEQMQGFLPTLKKGVDAAGGGGISVSQLEDKDWNRAWMEHFRPMRFGKHLWICPSWCEPPEPDAINISLDPGLAFGTGTHPTTALCLTWLDAHPPAGLHVIDYGCGSGILAIAALKLGARHVVAIDHDPQALTATRDNLIRNQLDSSTLETQLPGQLNSQGQGDYLLANILAQPLLDLAPLFATLVRPDGKIALSGILETQTDTIILRYQQWFTIDSLQTLDGWACLSGTRKKG